LRDFDARYFYTTSTFDKSVETVEALYNHLQYAVVSDRANTDINLTHKYSTDRFVFSPDFPSTNFHKMHFYNLTANQMRSLGEKVTTKYGLQLDSRNIESNDRGDHSDFHFGLYSLMNYQQEKLSLTGSLRLDYDENYAWELSPAVNASYVLDKLILRGSVARSIRSADYTERFVSNNLMNLTPGRSLGNPDLLAESAWTAELGVDVAPASGWQLSATAFTRFSSQLIDFISTNQAEIGSVSDIGTLREGEGYFFANNIADATTNGLELESQFSRDLNSSIRLRHQLGFAIYHTDTAEDLESVYLANSANHLLTNRLSLDLNHFTVSVSSLYKSRPARIASAIGSELEEQYTLWNAALRINLMDQFYIKGQILNLLDKEYQNILGAQMPGRWLSFGLGWQVK